MRGLAPHFAMRAAHAGGPVPVSRVTEAGGTGGLPPWCRSRRVALMLRRSVGTKLLAGVRWPGRAAGSRDPARGLGRRVIKPNSATGHLAPLAGPSWASKAASRSPSVSIWPCTWRGLGGDRYGGAWPQGSQHSAVMAFPCRVFSRQSTGTRRVVVHGRPVCAQYSDDVRSRSRFWSGTGCHGLGVLPVAGDTGARLSRPRAL